MADEIKKYLIDIESNLKKYAEEAAEAKKRVDELTAANKALKESGTATTAEIESSNAALRNAQKEYNQAKKMVDLQTAANKSEIGSRKQLSEILKLQEQALGKLGGAYIKNAQGVDILNPKYVEQRNQIAATKQKIIEYDQALNDGRSNIGRYGESVKSAFASAGKSMLSMVGPMALITAGIAAAKKIFEGLKDAIMSTAGAMNAMNIVGQITKQMFYDIAINGKLSAESMVKAAEAAKLMNEKRVGDRKDMIEFAALEREIAKLEFDAADKTKTRAERQEALNKAINKQNELSDKKIEDAKEDLRITQDLIQLRPKDDKLRQEEAVIIAKIIGLDKERFEQTKRNQGRMTAFRQEEIDDRKKLFDAYMAEIEKTNEANDKARAEEKAKAEKDEIERLSRIKKQIEDERAEKEKAGVAEIARLAKEYQDKLKQREDIAAIEKRDIDAGFEYQRLKAGENVDLLQTILDAEYGAMLASVEYKKLTTNEKLLIDQQYTEATKGLSMQRIQYLYDVASAEIDVAQRIGAALGELAGKNKTLAIASIVIEKASAIAQIIADTAVATAKAIKASPLTGGLPWSAINIAAGVASITALVAQASKSIAEIKKQPGEGGGGGESSVSIPTTIVSTTAAQRIASPAVGSSVLTQPQLTQQQLNALPAQNLLTAEDIANAVSKLPAPRVSVEDINARIKEKNKVEVRAII